MSQFLLELLTNAYALMGIIGLLAYGPTLFDVWARKSTINPWTYTVWWVSSAIAALYLGFVVGNTTMLLVYALHTLACSCVLSFNWRARRWQLAAVPVLEADLTSAPDSLG